MALRSLARTGPAITFGFAVGTGLDAYGGIYVKYGSFTKGAVHPGKALSNLPKRLPDVLTWIEP